MELQQIGASHPRVKQVLDLLRNAHPNPDRLFVAEGLWANEVLLAAGADVEAFLWCPEAAYTDQARRCAEQVAARAHRSFRVSERTLARIAERDRPDGLVSIARLPGWEPGDLSFGAQALVLVADGVEIPGNLGTLLRTLDACRADALVLTNRRTRLTHPKVFRGSHGCCLTVPSVEFADAGDAVPWLLEAGFRVLLADTDDAVPYRQADFTGRVAIVVGNERHGISRAWYGHGFARVCVPMLGTADSLNVAISASVLLYEARARQDGW